MVHAKTAMESSFCNGGTRHTHCQHADERERTRTLANEIEENLESFRRTYAQTISPARRTSRLSRITPAAHSNKCYQKCYHFRASKREKPQKSLFSEAENTTPAADSGSQRRPNRTTEPKVAGSSPAGCTLCHKDLRRVALFHLPRVYLGTLGNQSRRIRCRISASLWISPGA